MAAALTEITLSLFNATPETNESLVTNTEQIKGFGVEDLIYGWKLSATTDATDLTGATEAYLKIVFAEAGVSKTVTQKIAVPAQSTEVFLDEFYLPEDKTATVTATAATLFYA